MSIKMTLRILVALLLVPCALARAAAPPNIVFILADDLGYNDVGYHGSEIRTPNIDRLAAAGARLEQFYVQQVCTPTRAALMTGRYPFRYGLQRHVIMQASYYGLSLDERTLPAALKAAGYRTAIAGKWHLGHHEDAYFPQNRGFDFTYGMYWGRINYFTHELDEPKHEPGIGLDWHRNGEPLREEGYSTTLIGAQAARWIEQHDGKAPLFLYVPFNAPHSPLHARDEDLRRYADIKNPTRRTFAAMVSAMDEAIGRIIEALEKKQMRETTLIVFTSDNGGNAQFGGNNHPLRGGKNSLYEGGLRVPCLVAWPGRVKSGAIVQAPLHMIDWYPTLLTLAGAPLQQKLPIDGKDLWPAVTAAAPSPHDDIVLNVDGEQGAIRRGRWKLIVNEPTRASPQQPIELFDLLDDPNETKNLADAKPDIVKDLRSRLDACRSQAATPLQIVTGDKRPQRNIVLPPVIGTGKIAAGE